MIDAPITAAEAARRIAKRKLSSIELTEYCLARIAERDKSLNAFVLLLADEARAAARRADREIKAGCRRGPLHGVPYALKDIYETQGIRTTAHSKLLINHVPKRDGAVARRLKEAGGILIGKLATHEFATGGPAFDLPFPPARNPWHTAHFTGGSSSGSGAAAAAGLVPLTMGSDTSGSIRGPAAFCGIAGFKPSYGLVGRSGVIPLSYSLDHCGPMCWTVEDCALMLDAIAGHDPEDPASVVTPKPRFARAIAGGIRGMRIGVVRHFHESDMEATDEARAAIDAALEVLRKLGARLTDVTLPHADDWDASCRVILYAEAYAIHEKDLKTRPDDYAAITRGRLETGAEISAADYIHALRRRRQMCLQYAQAMDGLDALVTACSLAPAPVIADMAKPPYFTMRGRLVLAPFNMVGAPALSVCAGFSSQGLPLSIQITGRPFEDGTVLRVGHAYEQATPWREKRPN
ncbi:MAG: amidase [Alphaproteobacteria bacterium]|nr:amidase [Alphaproteobacteria bacterium]